MNPSACFLRDICEHPDDDTPRLVYADWLEDHAGEPDRAEFIRLQIRLANLTDDDPARPELVARERVLLQTHGREWVDALPRLVGASWTEAFVWPFRRGFAAGVTAENWKALNSQTETIFAAAPV
jgi:uncharacterized protein (TIGR02996 family)